MPSKPAMAAAVDIIQDADGLDCIINDSEQLVLAAIIDAHFALHLEAVEALRLAEWGAEDSGPDGTLPMCPACHNLEIHRHTDRCYIALILAKIDAA